MLPAIVHPQVACRPGVHSFGSGQARTYCGPATVTVHALGRTITIDAGACQRLPQAFVLNAGTIPVGTSTGRPSPNYFTLDVGRIDGSGAPAATDGTHTAFVMTFAMGGRTYLSAGTRVTLAGGRTRGTFSGTLLSGGAVTGSFRCG